jgi:hypothetical protein
MNEPIPAKQPPTPTLDRMPKNNVKKLRKLLHCIGLFTMKRTTGQAAGGSGSCSRWGVSARSFSWSDPAAELFCTADISFDVPAAIGWTSSLSVCEFGTPHEDATRSFAEQMQLASHARAVALCGPDFRGLLQCTAGCGTAALGATHNN